MIRTIKTNIKSGSDELIVVGPKTLLHGPNESGKSTVVEAIQLALTGGVYGVLFKDKIVKSGAQLCGLGSGDLYAEVETDSGIKKKREPNSRPKVATTLIGGTIAGRNGPPGAKARPEGEKL